VARKARVPILQPRENERRPVGGADSAPFRRNADDRVRRIGRGLLRLRPVVEPRLEVRIHGGPRPLLRRHSAPYFVVVVARTETPGRHQRQDHERRQAPAIRGVDEGHAPDRNQHRHGDEDHPHRPEVLGHRDLRYEKERDQNEREQVVEQEEEECLPRHRVGRLLDAQARFLRVQPRYDLAHRRTTNDGTEEHRVREQRASRPVPGIPDAQKVHGGILRRIPVPHVEQRTWEVPPGDGQDQNAGEQPEARPRIDGRFDETAHRIDRL